MSSHLNALRSERSAAARALSLAGLLAAAIFGLAGCAEEVETHPVRGQVVRVVDGGASLVIDHEEIPGVMAAMQMTLRVLDPTRAPALSPGDKIRFDLHLQEGRAGISGIETLPPDTELALGGHGEHGAGS